MNKYKVLGAEGADVDVLGEMRKAGDVVELTTEQAQPLVDAGTLELVTE
jgi:hypothetical protein